MKAATPNCKNRTMPIKPENRSRYPANWKAIRALILVRADNRCEKCRVENYAMICRGIDRDADTYILPDTGALFCAETGTALGYARVTDYHCIPKFIKIVLTIAHLDHTPENCDGMDQGGPALPIEQSNLRAWCQRCHLAHDAEHHRINAGYSRRSGRAIRDLFELGESYGSPY